MSCKKDMKYKFEKITTPDNYVFPKMTLPEEYKKYEDLFKNNVLVNDPGFTPLVRRVIQGKSKFEKISSNAGCLEITPEKCIYYGFYNNDNGEEDMKGCEMKTEDFYKLLIDWKNFLKSKKQYIESEEYDYEKLIKFMKENQFIGTYSLQYNKYGECHIKWQISKEVHYLILIGGHGGDDCISYFITINNKEYHIENEDFDTRDNEKLMKFLKEENCNENYVIAWKGFLGLPKFKMSSNKQMLSKYMNNPKYTIYKYGKAFE